jgi:hypothetical protein
MIVPDFWAEARKQQRVGKRQITVRRYGWSMTSEADALAMAETRASDALRRIVAGETLERLERKAAYNGASGTPIREEVVARHGDEVITRNAYGARCLNTPQALFADIDFASPMRLLPIVVSFAALLCLGSIAALYFKNGGVLVALLLLALAFAHPLAKVASRAVSAAQGGPERIAKRRVEQFVARYPTWSVRVYKTPAGLRLLVTHDTFDATAPEVRAFFAAVRADPVYVRMCANQRCFRARLTAKPWRIGIADHLRPRPGVWPVAAEKLKNRQQWVAQYERAAAGYAACHFLEVLGSNTVHRKLVSVIALHDRESQAQKLNLPLA